MFASLWNMWLRLLFPFSHFPPRIPGNIWQCLSTILGFTGRLVVKNPPANAGDGVWSLGRKDPLEKEMATHYSILAWGIPWTKEPAGLQSMGSQRVRHDLATKQQQQKNYLIVKIWGGWRLLLASCGQNLGCYQISYNHTQDSHYNQD